MLKYNENNLDLRSWISKDDVKSAEEVLMGSGMSYDKAQLVLQEVCHALLDLEIYDEESDEYSTC